MSIPQKIHYCWFGRNPLPKLAQKCIKSWRKYCPDYEIIQWNEDNYDLSTAPLYVRQAYEAKKWAFVTDYVRLQVVYEHGGIYLDTDVELKKSLSPLLKHEAYFGFEDVVHINTGLGFGAQKGAPVLEEMMADYAEIPFIQDNGSFDITTCPARNTQVLLRHGLIQNDSTQILDGGILILPSIYLCPIVYKTNVRRFSPETISVHWFSASWQTEDQRMRQKEYRKQAKKHQMQAKLHYVRHLPNLAVKTVLGDERYEKMKAFLKRG